MLRGPKRLMHLMNPPAALQSRFKVRSALNRNILRTYLRSTQSSFQLANKILQFARQGSFQMQDCAAYRMLYHQLEGVQEHAL